jgi:parallel beta-helix repeat protein
MKSKLLLIALLACVATSGFAHDCICVSTTGKDSNNGAAGQPLQSLDKVLSVAAMLKPSTDTLYICLAGGDYFLDHPIEINKPFNRPIVIKSKDKDKARLNGGIEIKDWEQYGKMYRARVPAVKENGYYFEQFYVNGRRAQLARTPNSGFFTSSGVVENKIDNNFAVQHVATSANTFSALNLPKGNALNRVQLSFYHKWDVTRRSIDSINTSRNELNISGSAMEVVNPLMAGTPFYAANYFNALDSTSEWFLDRDSGFIYYMPRPGENMATAQCIAPRLNYILKVNGTPDAPVCNVTFENIAFQYTSYVVPKEGMGPLQAAAQAQAALRLDYASRFKFIDCEMSHTGEYAIWLQRDCHDNTVRHCLITDLGAGGVKIGTPGQIDEVPHVTGGNIIDNNIIQHIGYVNPSAVGVIIFSSSDNAITHNDIGDSRYSGISCGWVWGYYKSQTAHNNISYNHIHHIGWGVLSDMAGIYTLGISPGTKISHNVVHDVLSYIYGGWGIYPDEGSSEILIKDNIAYRCKQGGFHQHYGMNNSVINNIFALNTFYQLQYTRPEDHQSFEFKHNIILQDSGITAAGAWLQGKVDVDSNLYYSYDGRLKFLHNKSFEQWKEHNDAHSIVADPHFTDPHNGDFHFTSTDNVKKIGFVPFDYTQAGVYGSQEWKDKAKLSPEILKQFQHATESSPYNIDLFQNF